MCHPVEETNKELTRMAAKCDVNQETAFIVSVCAVQSGDIWAAPEEAVRDLWESIPTIGSQRASIKKHGALSPGSSMAAIGFTDLLYIIM